MEKFLSTGELTVEEIRCGPCERVVQCDLAPVFCCSGYHNLGVKEVLDEVVDVLPSPLDVHPQTGAGSGGGGTACKVDASEPFAATIFKTLAEAHLGELSLIRLWSGQCRARQGTAEHHAQPFSEARHALPPDGQGALGLQRACRGGDIVAGW